MKRHLCLLCGALAGIAILPFTAFAEAANSTSVTAAPVAGSAPHKTNGPESRNIQEECTDEWKAGKEAMMKRGMTEDRYVEQCSVKDDVPAVPSENAAPPAAPNRPPDR